MEAEVSIEEIQGVDIKTEDVEVLTQKVNIHIQLY